MTQFKFACFLMGFILNGAGAQAFTVSPTSLNLNSPKAQQFTASEAVTWTLSYGLGSISASGLYTPPAAQTGYNTVFVVATKKGKSAQTVKAQITLSPYVSAPKPRPTATPIATPTATPKPTAAPVPVPTVTATPAPVISFQSTPASTSTLTLDSISFTVAGGGVTQLQCSLDSAAFSNCASPVGLMTAVGTHQFQVRGIDAGAKVLATSSLYQWTVVAVLAPTTGTMAGWLPCAIQGSTCILPTGATQVRYGQDPDDAGVNFTRTFTISSVLCQNENFGGNPNTATPWATNLCWYKGNVANIQPISTLTGPAINLPVVSPAFPGSSLAQIRSAGTDPSQQPGIAGGDVASFRDLCGFSHFAFDDPIVFPGQPGKSHLHQFFGNSGANAYSTSTTLQSSGSSTCGGGTLNRSGYWVPAMIDTATHNPVRPTQNNVYYKSGYNGISAKNIHAVPQGLVMIAGSAANTVSGVNPVGYACVGPVNISAWSANIPNCNVGDDLVMEVTFPQCWDGVNLDSTNHQSHMSNTVNGSCPADHPVAIPVISYNIHYPTVKANSTKGYQLSSDNYDTSNGHAGYSGHGDYMYGWDTPTMETIISNCINGVKDCHDFLLGNGQTLY